MALRGQTGELLPVRRTLGVRPGLRLRGVLARLGDLPHATQVAEDGSVRIRVTAGVLFPATSVPSAVDLTHVFFPRGFAREPRADAFSPGLADLDRLVPLMMNAPASVSWTASPARQLLKYCHVIDLFRRRSCYLLDVGRPEVTVAYPREVMG